MEWLIRDMQEKDLEKVEALEQCIFSVPWSMRSLQEAITKPENLYLVCEENGQIAGYCGMWGVLGEGNIMCVAVAPEYRNRGVGNAMMQELLQRGRKEKAIDVFFLEVRESNAVAIHLYEKNGFKSIGLRKNFYEKPLENAKVMSIIYNKQTEQ